MEKVWTHTGLSVVDKSVWCLPSQVSSPLWGSQDVGDAREAKRQVFDGELRITL